MEKQFLFKQYNDDIDWNVAGLFSQDEVLLYVCDELKKNEMDFPISYVFGSIPCLLQGGHLNAHEMSLSDAFRIIDRYDELGIGCRLTLSNHMLEKWDIREKKPNKLLDYLNQKDNATHGAIVTSDLLADHIRKKYTNLQLTSSVIKPAVEVGWGSETPEYYNHLLNLYDIVVVNIALAEDIDFLKEIKYPERCEFIANSHCYPNCKNSAKHYTLSAQLAVAESTNTKKPTEELIAIEKACTKQRANAPLVGTNLTYEKINELIDMGFVHYKIEGRNFPPETLLKELGYYAFNTPYFNRFLHAIYNKPV